MISHNIQFLKGLYILIRFANLIQLTNLNWQQIWKVVKKIKLETGLNKKCSKNSIYDLGYYLGYSKEDNIKQQVLKVEKQLEVNSSDQIFYNMTVDDLKTAAEIFIYLNMCPPTDDTDTDQWFNNWNNFYIDLFETQSLEQILLTINRMTKVKPLNMDGKVRAEKILEKLLGLLSSTIVGYEHLQRMFRRGLETVSPSEDHQFMQSLPIQGRVQIYNLYAISTHKF